MICKEALQMLAITEDIKLSRSTRDHILDNDIFWIQLEKVKTLLEPIVKWITILEGNDHTMSKVFTAVHEIEAILGNTVKLLPIKKNEEKELMVFFEKRKTMLLKPIHLAANLLDPNFCGINLNNE